MRTPAYCAITLLLGVRFSVVASQTERASGTHPEPPPKTGTRASETCAPASFLTFASGDLVGVVWEDRNPDRIHTHTVLMQSRVIDSTIDLRADGTAVRASTILSEAGEEPGQPTVRSMGEGAVYWSDMNVSSVEQAILRARVLGQTSSRLPSASLFSDSRGEVSVERLGPTDWVVESHHKRYLVLTDDQGCMVAATLPEHGVTIERRVGFAQSQYPLWPAYGPPPDHAYDATEVSIPTPQGNLLAGTLTMPLHPKPVPAAVVITGLSPSERNGGAPPWMPLRDIADALTRGGLAALRVDDRGIGKSTGDHKSSTTFDEADDVRTEVAWLRKQPGVDPDRIVLVGYSEGGLIAPMVAAKDARIAAIVTLAGPGTSGADLARYQNENIVVRDPTIPESNREDAIQKRLAEDLTPRERSVLAIDPLEFARKVRCPALIMQGSNDLHVPLRSAERIANAMRASGNGDVSVRVIPGLSHSLLPDPIGLGSEWVYLPAFKTSPQLLGEMGRWLSAHVGRGPRP